METAITYKNQDLGSCTVYWLRFERQLVCVYTLFAVTEKKNMNIFVDMVSLCNLNIHSMHYNVLLFTINKTNLSLW